MNPAPLTKTRKRGSIKKCGSEPRPFLALGWILGRRRSGVNIKRCRVKKDLRERILKRRNREPELLQRTKSEKIRERLFSLGEFKEADIILFYLSKGSEVRTGEAIEKVLLKGKRVALPRIERKEIILREIKNLGRDVEKGSFGILEPRAGSTKEVLPEEPDLLILPGVAFDLGGRRIGYGKGYYDRFLEKIPSGIPLIGLAYDFQIVKSFPAKRGDRRVSKVVTEERVISAKCKISN